MSSRARSGMRGWMLGCVVAAFGVGTLALSAIAPASALAACNLGNGVKHVVILQFDNVHLARDNAGVPSDLEQMPALHSFLTGNGSLLSNDHTVLISHTAGGIVSTETGLYPDRNGLTVTNSYEFFDRLAASGVGFSSAFKYWTDPDRRRPRSAADADHAGQKNTPAPWVAFTRAGCDFAGVGAADMELENTTSDVTQVFGAGSGGGARHVLGTSRPARPGATSPSPTSKASRSTARRSRARPAASASNGGRTRCPTSPDGYTGYKGLFGALHVNPFLTGQPATTVPGAPAPPGLRRSTTCSRPTRPTPARARVTSSTSPPASCRRRSDGRRDNDVGDRGRDRNSGFPGFDGTEANNALGYTAAMQEAGIPVTYTYLSTSTTTTTTSTTARRSAPVRPAMEAQLRQYNAAFGRSSPAGRRQHQPGQHAVPGDRRRGRPFAGGHAELGCDRRADDARPAGPRSGRPASTAWSARSTSACSRWCSRSPATATKFGFNFDDAPNVFVPNPLNPAAGSLSPTDATVRNLEREMNGLSACNPITNRQRQDRGRHRRPAPSSGSCTCRTRIRLRLPTFTMFGDPGLLLPVRLHDGTARAVPGGCPVQGPGFAWNHGDEQPGDRHHVAGLGRPGREEPRPRPARSGPTTPTRCPTRCSRCSGVTRRLHRRRPSDRRDHDRRGPVAADLLALEQGLQAARRAVRRVRARQPDGQHQGGLNELVEATRRTRPGMRSWLLARRCGPRSSRRWTTSCTTRRSTAPRSTRSPRSRSPSRPTS